MFPQIDYLSIIVSFGSSRVKAGMKLQFSTKLTKIIQNFSVNFALIPYYWQTFIALFVTSFQKQILYYWFCIVYSRHYLEIVKWNSARHANKFRISRKILWALPSVNQNDNLEENDGKYVRLYNDQIVQISPFFFKFISTLIKKKEMQTFQYY